MCKVNGRKIRSKNSWAVKYRCFTPKLIIIKDIFVTHKKWMSNLNVHMKYCNWIRRNLLVGAKCQYEFSSTCWMECSSTLSHDKLIITWHLLEVSSFPVLCARCTACNTLLLHSRCYMLTNIVSTIKLMNDVAIQLMISIYLTNENRHWNGRK